MKEIKKFKVILLVIIYLFNHKVNAQILDTIGESLQLKRKDNIQYLVIPTNSSVDIDSQIVFTYAPYIEHWKTGKFLGSAFCFDCFNLKNRIDSQFCEVINDVKAKRNDSTIIFTYSIHLPNGKDLIWQDVVIYNQIIYLKNNKIIKREGKFILNYPKYTKEEAKRIINSYKEFRQNFNYYVNNKKYMDSLDIIFAKIYTQVFYCAFNGNKKCKDIIKKLSKNPKPFRDKGYLGDYFYELLGYYYLGTGTLKYIDIKH